MKRGLKQQNLALTVSFLFLGIVCLGFFWLWQSSKPSEGTGVVLEEKYNPVEIGSVKQKAQDLITAKGNLIQMPIKAPVDNVGRANPFDGI